MSRPPGPALPAVDVFGFFEAELGVGEAGRLLVKALAAAGLEHNTPRAVPAGRRARDL
jgi:hypothetical protein